MRLSTALFAFLSLPLLTSCNESTGALEARVAALEAQLAALNANAQPIQFSQIQGTIDDAQVPDDITIAFAATAGDADTLDGYHASQIAESGSFNPFVLAPWYVPAAPFQYLRTGSRVRVTGVLNLVGLAILPESFQLGDLPYRMSSFQNSTDAVGTATAALTNFGNAESVSATLAAEPAVPFVRISLTPLGFFILDGGTIAVEFSYDVDP